MTLAISNAAAVESSKSQTWSGFGTRQEEDLYDQLCFNTVRLLSARTAKYLQEMTEGNYNPYSKAQANEDTRLK